MSISGCRHLLIGNLYGDEDSSSMPAGSLPEGALVGPCRVLLFGERSEPCWFILLFSCLPVGFVSERSELLLVWQLYKRRFLPH